MAHSSYSTQFLGPFPNGKYALVMINERSRYPVVVFTNSASAKYLKAVFGMFSNFGYPEELVSGNGPPFRSEEIKRYMLTRNQTSSRDTIHNSHFFLRCHHYTILRADLMNGLKKIDENILRLSENSLVKLLLFGDPKYNLIGDCYILNASIILY